MHRRMIRQATLIAIALTLLVGCTSPAATGPTPAVTVVEKTVLVTPTAVPTKSVIKLGVNQAFTGNAAYAGEGYMMGATMALEELNWQIAGHPIELVSADTACNPEQAVSAFRKLVDVDQADLILGSGCSSCTLAVMPLLRDAGIAQLTGTSTSPDIFDGAGEGRNEWQFRVNVDDRMNANAFGPYVAEQVKSIAFLVYSDDFGRSVVNTFKPMFEQLGVTVTGIEYFDRGAADIRPSLLKLQQGNPEGLMLSMTENEAPVVLRQFRELGLKQKIFNRGTFLTGLFQQMTEKEPGLAEGAVESSWWGLGMDPKFDTAFQERWGSAPTSNRAVPYYIVRYVVKDAIERADKTGKVDRASLRDALKQVSVDTPIGKVDFDDHNQAYTNMSVATMKDGAIVQEAVLSTRPK